MVLIVRALGMCWPDALLAVHNVRSRDDLMLQRLPAVVPFDGRRRAAAGLLHAATCSPEALPVDEAQTSGVVKHG
jgi:hypothetical protein